MPTFQEAARELAAAFTTGTRPSGETFSKLADTAAPWTKTVPHAVHVAVDNRAPCDWIYRQMASAADMVAEHESAEDARDAAAEFADSAVDVYTDRLFQWATEGRNRDLCDEAAQDMRHAPAAAVEWIRLGQFYAAERIVYAVIQSVEAQVSE